MTITEIINALRCCADSSTGCGGCPFVGKCIHTHADLKLAAVDTIQTLCNQLATYYGKSIRNEKRIVELEKELEIWTTRSFEGKIGSMALTNLNLKMEISKLKAQLPKEGVCEAKKPKTVKETEYSFYCDCPTCGRRLISNVDGEWYAGSFDRFCRMCGQKIDWSEYCGWSNKPYCGAKMDGEEQNDE